MNKLVYITILLLVFLACNSKKKQTINHSFSIIDPVKIDKKDSILNDSLIKQNIKNIDTLPIHGKLDPEKLAQYYPSITGKIKNLGVMYSEKLDLNPENGTIVSLLHNTGAYKQMILCTHNQNLELIDQLYIGKATDFDDGKSQTIDYSIQSNNKIVFNKISWKYKQDSDEEIDTLNYEKLNIHINDKGFIKYKPLQLCNDSPLEVYVNDPDPKGVNIRKEPNGEIILNLNKQDEYFILTITEAKNGWFKVSTIKGAEIGIIKNSEKIGWIHNSSIIEAGTRRDIALIDKPQNGRVVGTINQETQVTIKDKCANWVKIEYKELTGWVSVKWLCGNPYTTCP